MVRVLIAESDPAAAERLLQVVRSIRLEADCVTSGEAALNALRAGGYGLLLLAIELEGMNGFQVIRTLRAEHSKLPIIVVSRRSDDFDTLYGLDLGADNYVTKPFNPITLGAKIRALIRRASGELSQGGELLLAGPFSYNTSTLRLFKDGTEIPLTAKENAMMKLFLDNVNRVLTKPMLYDLIWGDAIIDENAIMVYIKRLRQKIEDDPVRPQYIQTVRGIGYRFVV